MATARAATDTRAAVARLGAVEPGAPPVGARCPARRSRTRACATLGVGAPAAGALVGVAAADGLVLDLGPDELEALRLSLEVSLSATLIAAPLGVGLGWLLARRRFPGRFLLDVAVHLPLVLTPVVVGYLLLLVFGRNGLLGPLLDALHVDLAFGFEGAVMAAATMALPLVVRTARAAFELVDPGLEQAAAVLGAGPLRRFATVTLPLAAPGVVAGCVLGFARAVGEFGATITFAGSIAGETRTLPLAIYGATQVPDGEGAALRLTLLSVAISGLALGASELFLRALRRRAAEEAR